MPRGGVVRVRAGVTELRGALTTTRTGKIPPGEYVTVAVEDDGVGMDTDVHSQLFEPFFTTKPQDKGTGLGLPTVFGILKQHNAGITVESDAGKGSRFTMSRPSSRSPGGSSNCSAARHSPPRAGARRSGSCTSERARSTCSSPTSACRR